MRNALDREGCPSSKTTAMSCCWRLMDVDLETRYSQERAFYGRHGWLVDRFRTFFSRAIDRLTSSPFISPGFRDAGLEPSLSK